MPDDVYQARYLAHQRRKAAVLAEVLAERHSDRRFGDQDVTEDDAAPLLAAAEQAPSSCDRRGVRAVPVRGRDERALLGGLLVGGVGWIHRAPLVILLVADPAAYKAAGELEFMPYLDAGMMAGQMWLAATAAGLAACFCNPNIRAANRGHFADRFGPGVFCGALAVGWPAPPPPWVLETS